MTFAIHRLRIAKQTKKEVLVVTDDVGDDLFRGKDLEVECAVRYLLFEQR